MHLLYVVDFTVAGSDGADPYTLTMTASFGTGLTA